MKKGAFWGSVAAVISVVPAAAAGVAKGTYNAATGNGSFTEGYNETSEAVFDAAYKFGEEHSDMITGAVITTAAGTVARKTLPDHPNKSN